MAKSQQQLYFYTAEGLAFVKSSSSGGAALLRAAGRVMAQRDDHQVALYGTDILGSIAHYLEGGELCSLQYTLYGYDSGKLCASVLRFNSQRKDRLIEGYHLGNGHRTYSPTCMRFNSPDTRSPYDEGGVNAYSYCGGDPINRSDPSGRSWWSLSSLRKLLFGKSSRVETRTSKGVIHLLVQPSEKQERFNREMNERLNVHNKLVFKERAGIEAGKLITSQYKANSGDRVQSFSNGHVELLKGPGTQPDIAAEIWDAKPSATGVELLSTRPNINEANQFSAAKDDLSKRQLQIRS